MTAFRFSLRAGSWRELYLSRWAMPGLVYPSPLYASLLAAALLAILATALVAALVSPGRYRALGLGILVFAGCYGLAFWKFGSAIRFTDMLDDVHSRLSGAEVVSPSELESIRDSIVGLERVLGAASTNQPGYTVMTKELASLRASIDATQARESFMGVGEKKGIGEKRG